jgi:hypothetical protein
MVLSMCLQLTQSFPHDLAFTLWTWASVRELAKVNTVSKYLVDILQEVALSIAVWAAHLMVWTET